MGSRVHMHATHSSSATSSPYTSNHLFAFHNFVFIVSFEKCSFRSFINYLLSNASFVQVIASASSDSPRANLISPPSINYDASYCPLLGKTHRSSIPNVHVPQLSCSSYRPISEPSGLFYTGHDSPLRAFHPPFCVTFEIHSPSSHAMKSIQGL